MNRSLIMSMADTFTPKLLFSLARSCLRTRTLVLKPVSDSSDPSFKPSAKAVSSSGLSKLGRVAMGNLLHHKRSEHDFFNTAKVFVLFKHGVHHVFEFDSEFFAEFRLAGFGFGGLTHDVEHG